MQERRKLFYTESEINELANAVEYTSGTVSDNIDYLFVPIANLVNYQINLKFCNSLGNSPYISSGSTAKLISEIQPNSSNSSSNSAYVIGYYWRISSDSKGIKMYFNGTSSGSEYDANFYTSNGSSNYSGDFCIIPYRVQSNSGSRYFYTGFFDYLYDPENVTYIKIQINGRIGISYNGVNYCYNKIVSSSTNGRKVYYIPVSN